MSALPCETSSMLFAQFCKCVRSGTVLATIAVSLLLVACRSGIANDATREVVLQGHERAKEADTVTLAGEDGEEVVIRTSDILHRQAWKSSLYNVPGEPVQLTLRPGAEVRVKATERRLTVGKEIVSPSKDAKLEQRSEDILLQGHERAKEADTVALAGEDGEEVVIRTSDILHRQAWKSSLYNVPGEPVQLTLRPGAEVRVKATERRLTVGKEVVSQVTGTLCKCPILSPVGHCCAQPLGTVWLKTRSFFTSACYVTFALCTE